MKTFAAFVVLIGFASPATGQDPALFYEADGEGPAVVFVPDWAHTTTSWFPTLVEMRPGWRLVRYDLRGQGRSDPAPDGDYSLDAHVADLGRVVDALGLERVRLVGSGVGATIALAFARDRPDRVVAVVAIAPKAGWTDEERAWWGRFFEAYDRVGRPTLAAYTSVLVDRWFGTAFPTLNPWIVGFYDLMLRRQDPEPLLASLERWIGTDFVGEGTREVPVLGVWGGRQRSSVGENRIRAVFPRYDREVLRDVRERPAIEAPRDVALRILRFFERHPGPS